MKRGFLNKFFLGFLNGIVIILPIIVTVWIIKFLAFMVNDVVLTPFSNILAAMGLGVERVYLVKILIFFIVVSVVVAIGWAARILFITRIFSWGEKIFIKVPIMGKIYNAVKQISSAFLGQGKTIFKQVVLLEYPRKGLYSLGFTTGVTKGELKYVHQKNSVNVFIPTTPNPTSGMFIVVPKDEIRFLKMSVEDGMKLIVSGGAVSPEFTEE